MTERLSTVAASASLEDVYSLLNRGLVAVVMDGEDFLGLITRTDLLNFMRRGCDDRRFRYARDSCRPGARCFNGRHYDAYLCDEHLCAVESWGA